MQKLQELLEKHKDKIGYSFNNVKLTEFDGQYYISMIDNFMLADDVTYKDLSHLLFSTPFLSLLEWKRNITFTEMRVKTIYEDTNIESDLYYENNHNFHKINLALLESDKERVEYIESFTL